MRLDRMQQVIRHDLPNQMVAVQGLLHLMNADEAKHLSAAAREYVCRLQNAARRASEMVRFLKQMDQLGGYVPRMEEISLAMLSRELQGELHRRHPDKQFAFEWNWMAPKIVADSRTLLRGLLELTAGLVQETSTRYRLRASSEARENAIALAFELGRTDGVAASTLPRWSAHALDQSLQIALARELLALSKSVLEIASPTDGAIAFRILITPETPS